MSQTHTSAHHWLTCAPQNDCRYGSSTCGRARSRCNVTSPQMQFQNGMEIRSWRTRTARALDSKNIGQRGNGATSTLGSKGPEVRCSKHARPFAATASVRQSTQNALLSNIR
eukprot:347075-Chlamydomonas_euryale.AAC.1